MAAPNDRAAESEFEADVLRIARAIFAPENQFQGSMYIGEAERDGVFIGPDSVTVVECTVSGRKDKAEKDGGKLKEACARLATQHPFKAVKGFFVTKNEPTADQRAVVKRLGPPLVACSFSQLRSLLVDSKTYLECRSNYPFGSAREPGSGNYRTLKQYVPVDFIEESSGESVTLNAVASKISRGKSILIHGDYGAGKSMFLRELYNRLSRDHQTSTSASFPILLNLRDHQGQVVPAEALERHARNVGFHSPPQLVRAWRSGYVTLILDGFDEIATPGWIGKTSAMRDIRRRSVEIVRRFFDESHPTSSIILAGRSHFFDSEREMRSSLGVPPDCCVLSSGDLTEDQIRQILAVHGWTNPIPDWLPSRPLLLGYLGASEILGHSIEGTVDTSVGDGWNILLGRIADREASMEVGVDGITVRKIIERIATHTRRSSDGLGPISQDQLTSVFHSVCGYAPDEGSYQLLQRLPGLGAMDSVDGSRRFIDVSLADAARAGDIVSLIANSADTSMFSEAVGTAVPLDAVGIDVAASRILEEMTASANQAFSAIAAVQKAGLSDSLVADVLRIAARIWPPEAPQFGIPINEVELRTLAIPSDAIAISKASFQDCIVQELDLTEYDGSVSLPYFHGCIIGQVLGVAGWGTLQAEKFTDCEVMQFDAQLSTNKGILALVGLSPVNRVILTILKKVYAQRGSGRRDSALYRGLDEKHRSQVAEAIDRLITNQLITMSKMGNSKIYLPVRGMRSRVNAILQSPQVSSDPVLSE